MVWSLKVITVVIGFATVVQEAWQQLWIRVGRFLPECLSTTLCTLYVVQGCQRHTNDHRLQGCGGSMLFYYLLQSEVNRFSLYTGGPCRVIKQSKEQQSKNIETVQVLFHHSFYFCKVSKTTHFNNNRRISSFFLFYFQSVSYLLFYTISLCVFFYWTFLYTMFYTAFYMELFFYRSYFLLVEKTSGSGPHARPSSQ